MSKNSRLVYSTETGRIKPQDDKPTSDNSSGDGISGDGIVRLKRETKGRKGKGVTLVTGVPLAEAELKKLAKTLKQKCGVGGAVKDGVIEIQTDDRDKLKQLLEAQGFTVKLAGG
jgi:translation initiation factor 1